MPSLNKQPTVSIICVTYNHKDYIATALDSFLKQKTDFSYEVIIHDDASTDGTQEVIKEYKKKYPNIIKPIFARENRFSKGDFNFVAEMFALAKGKYIAQCEGDDFWTDMMKLQKQVDFLEANQEYALVFHPVKVIYQNGEEADSVYPNVSKDFAFDLSNLLKTNFIQSNAVMYKRQKYKDLNPNVMPGDWYLHLYHAQFGKIGFINRAMSVYRKHQGGIWWEVTRDAQDEIWKKHGAGHLVLYTELLRMYGDQPRYRRIIDQHIEGTVEILNRIDRSSKSHLMKNFVTAFPELSGPLLLSLSRTVYKNYLKAEKDRGMAEQESVKNKRLIRIAQEEIKALRRDREIILNSNAYRVGNKIAQVSRVVRRRNEE